VSPPYSAAIGCVPAASVEVLRVAWPEAFSVPVPSGTAPSLNVTVPDGTPAGEVTMAVKTTVWPATAGFSDEATLVEVVARVTVCVTGADVLARNMPVSEYEAVIVCEPGDRTAVRVAFPEPSNG